MQRIGVFVCHCGSNIAATVDVKKVVEMALREQGMRSLRLHRCFRSIFHMSIRAEQY